MSVYHIMSKNLYYIFLMAIAIVWSSCRKDFETELSSGNLEFSRDTVFLDTVFTNIGSATYTLRVYNRSNDDIRIPTVRLGFGQESRYRLNVDGVAGKEFDNVEILAKDSIFIFIETTVDIDEFTTTGTQFLYNDAIEFDSGERQQEVALVTLVQDAVFLFPQRFDDGTIESVPLGLDENGNEVRIQGFFLEEDELLFTNEKPYVIYGYAAVSPGHTLTMEPGVRVHFHEDSGILVGTNASLKINGQLSTDTELLENEVIFEGDRLEPEFSDIPGQWGTIWLAGGSIDHEINHLTIKNATVGILTDANQAGTPALSIANSQIHNASNVGLWGRNASVYGENLVVGSAGQLSFYGNLGGRYQFKHSTFANYWRSGFREFPAVLVDNFIDLGDNGIVSEDLETALFENCIIYGTNDLEFFAEGVSESALNYKLDHCLLRFNDFSDRFTDDPRFDFSNTALYENIFLNEDPDFLNTRANDFRIGENSAANARGDISVANDVPLDILGVNRTTAPDLGAFQSIPTNGNE